MELQTYVDADGADVFLDDLKGLPSRASQRVQVALDRMSEGNLGDHKSLGEGLWEHRIHAEGGVRTYFAKVGQRCILLLTTGMKSDQSGDIRVARSRLADYDRRNHSP
jgi:putative addiction module killer protein